MTESFNQKSRLSGSSLTLALRWINIVEIKKLK